MNMDTFTYIHIFWGGCGCETLRPIRTTQVVEEEIWTGERCPHHSEPKEGHEVRTKGTLDPLFPSGDWPPVMQSVPGESR